jgi:hypothetical protein
MDCRRLRSVGSSGQNRLSTAKRGLWVSVASRPMKAAPSLFEMQGLVIWDTNQLERFA